MYLPYNTERSISDGSVGLSVRGGDYWVVWDHCCCQDGLLGWGWRGWSADTVKSHRLSAVPMTHKRHHTPQPPQWPKEKLSENAASTVFLHVWCGGADSCTGDERVGEVCEVKVVWGRRRRREKCEVVCGTDSHEASAAHKGRHVTTPCYLPGMHRRLLVPFTAAVSLKLGFVYSVGRSQPFRILTVVQLLESWRFLKYFEQLFLSDCKVHIWVHHRRLVSDWPAACRPRPLCHCSSISATWCEQPTRPTCKVLIYIYIILHDPPVKYMYLHLYNTSQYTAHTTHLYSTYPPR